MLRDGGRRCSSVASQPGRQAGVLAGLVGRLSPPAGLVGRSGGLLYKQRQHVGCLLDPCSWPTPPTMSTPAPQHSGTPLLHLNLKLKFCPKYTSRISCSMSSNSQWRSARLQVCSLGKKNLSKYCYITSQSPRSDLRGTINVNLASYQTNFPLIFGIGNLDTNSSEDEINLEKPHLTSGTPKE